MGQFANFAKITSTSDLIRYVMTHITAQEIDPVWLQLQRSFVCLPCLRVLLCVEVQRPQGLVGVCIFLHAQRPACRDRTWFDT